MLRFWLVLFCFVFDCFCCLFYLNLKHFFSAWFELILYILFPSVNCNYSLSFLILIDRILYPICISVINLWSHFDNNQNNSRTVIVLYIVIRKACLNFLVCLLNYFSQCKHGILSTFRATR